MNQFSKIISGILLAIFPTQISASTPETTVYTPSAEVMASQSEFEADRFGIFIHWGIYSMFARGEWYLNYGIPAEPLFRS